MSVSADEIRKLSSPHLNKTGGVITALRSIQNKFRHIPNEADAIVAELFNLSRAEIRGVISFYADFSRKPKADHVVRICVAEACQAAGVVSALSDIEKALGTRIDAENQEADIAIEKVFCLGLCSVAPAAMVDDALVGRADAARIQARLGKRS